jgi:four helix bundle protein
VGDGDVQDSIVDCSSTFFLFMRSSESDGKYYQEGIQFYRISRASIYELKDHLISCYDLKFIQRVTLEKGIKLIEDAKITLNGYINYVKSQKNNIK